MNKAQALIGMVQYYRDMWTRRSHISAHLTEADIGPKDRKILWNDVMEQSFKEIKHMVSAQTLQNYRDRPIPFILHTDASNKQLGAVILQNIKPNAFYRED